MGGGGSLPRIDPHGRPEGELSFSFLETPGWALPGRPDRTYRELSEQQGVPLSLILGLHEVIGFQAPGPDERVRRDELVMVELARTFLEVGASEAAVRRVFHLYADNLRRLATAEAELYQAEVARPLQQEGLTETELMRYGSQLGQRMTPLVHRTLLGIYERHRQHVWSESSILHAEAALERAGLHQRLVRPPAVCFVDLTGYTRLTEEQGDEAAARLAASLAALVEDISRRHDGRPVRWLGDGGMFLFKEPTAGMVAALEMVGTAPEASLPPTHIGIHAGPVVSQDGDVFGRTVNIAARIAARAGAGEVLTSSETVELVEDARSDSSALAQPASRGSPARSSSTGLSGANPPDLRRSRLMASSRSTCGADRPSTWPTRCPLVGLPSEQGGGGRRLSPPFMGVTRDGAR
jgi:adenylate cyclase